MGNSYNNIYMCVFVFLNENWEGTRPSKRSMWSQGLIKVQCPGQEELRVSRELAEAREAQQRREGYGDTMEKRQASPRVQGPPSPC